MELLPVTRKERSKRLDSLKENGVSRSWTTGPNVRVRFCRVKRKVADLPCATAEIGLSKACHKIA